MEVHDLASPPIPFFVFHDATFRVLLRHYDEATGGVPYYPGLPVDTVRRLRDRQERVFDEATGILAMSHWLARELTAAGYPADKVTVVHPGINAVSPPVEAERHPALERRRVRLLFVGKVYYAKGGDLVLAALERLRSSYDPNITLTVAGLPAWGSPEPPPPGVDYVGRRSLPEVARLYDTHDLFVMPSRMEPFGIVFLEALARGLPCVGRNAFAMPEVIRPGENGALIERDDPDELATAIVRVLEDEHVYTSCWADRDDFARRHSWDRAATEVIGVVEAAVGGI